MGIRIINGDGPYDGACLYCSTSMWAFGPVFKDHSEAEDFLDWIGDGKDLRLMTDKELEGHYLDYLTSREEEKQEQEEA